MKTLKIAATVLFLTVVNVANAAIATAENDTTAVKTQNDKALFNTLEKSLVFGLGSDVKGVVESTLHNAISYKVAYPEFDSEKALQRINRIAVEGDTHNLRYKAYLTLAYYKNQELFDTPETLMTVIDNRNQDKIFFYLQEELQSSQLTSN